jgi:hypothetical protein
MITQFVSKSAVARIFQVATNAIVRIECWTNCVLVVFKKGFGRCRFVSYKTFTRDAAEVRLENALNLPGDVLAQGGGTYFQVRSSSGHDWYTVDLTASTCECADHIYRDARCKHLLLASTFKAVEDMRSMPISEAQAEDALACLGF